MIFSNLILVFNSKLFNGYKKKDLLYRTFKIFVKDLKKLVLMNFEDIIKDKETVSQISHASVPFKYS